MRRRGRLAAAPVAAGAVGADDRESDVAATVAAVQRDGGHPILNVMRAWHVRDARNTSTRHTRTQTKTHTYIDERDDGVVAPVLRNGPRVAALVILERRVRARLQEDAHNVDMALFRIVELRG